MSVLSFNTRSPIPPKWRKFFAERGEVRSFFFSLPWFTNFDQNALEPGVESIIYGAENASGEPVAALISRTPAGQEASALRGLFPGPNSVAALSNYQSTMFAMLTSDEDREDHRAIDEIARHLIDKKVTALELNLLPPGDRATGQLVEALRARGQLVQTFEDDFMIFEDVSDSSFDDFWKTRSSRLKNTHRRREKQLAKKGKIRFEMIQDTADVERGIDSYNQVFGVSWKDPEEFPDFTPGLIHAAAAAGALRLGILFLDAQPISAQLWLVSGGVASIFKLHYVDEYKDYSPGTICSHRMMRHVIDVDHVKEIDFGRGTSTYKKWWMHNERKMLTLVSFNPKTARGLICFSLFSMWKALRQFRELLAEGIIRPWRRWRSQKPSPKLAKKNANSTG
jgi:CelD/BcsL family acetyltransferase involved in cellulose biosynthesis